MSEEIVVKPRVTNIERFQPLQAGQYWQARVNVKDQNIRKGDVLLIQSLRWVDDAIHTVVLRAHPRHYGDTWYQTIGKTRSYRGELREHRFLVADFLIKFEFAPDAREVRAAELAAITERIRALQGELADGQTSREKFIALAAAEEKEAPTCIRCGKPVGKVPPYCNLCWKSIPDDLKSTPMATETSIVPASLNSEMSLTAAISSGITQQKIDDMRALVSNEAKVAQVQAKWIKEKVEEISGAVMEMTPYYQEQAAAALAATEDVQSYVKSLLDGIGSLELYVGTNVDVVEIQKGVSAPIESPLTIMQQKLYMDEELSVWADIDETFDFRSQDTFVDALQTSKGLVDQIFAADRCVVAMAITRRERDYGDPWIDKEFNKNNRRVFLLIRDGENLYQVHSPVESHLGSARLFPATDESNNKFHGYDGSTITFQDVRYTDKLSEHEAMALHYKRFLILLCGLDHRLNLFGAFYPGPKNFQFVQEDFQEQHFRFVHDDDGEGMLPGESRPSFTAWIAEMNEYVREGSRLFCSWSDIMTDETAPGAYRAQSRNYERSRTCDITDRYGVAVVYGKDGKLYVDTPVKQYSYKHNKDRFFKVKTLVAANLHQYRSSLPFLCLDNINPVALDWYIHNRKSRESFLGYVEFFKRALRLVETERKEEQATRKAIAEALLEGNLAAPGEIDDIVQRSVVTWRATKSGKALPEFGTANWGDWKSLLNLAYLLAGNAKSRAADIDVWVSTLGYKPLRLTAAGSARMVLYTAPKADEIDDRMFPHVWTHQLVLEPQKSGDYLVKTSEWALLPKVSASETVIHEWPEAKGWAKDPQAFLSYSQKKEMFDVVAQFESQVGKLIHADESYVQSLFERWRYLRERLSVKVVCTPTFTLPFGLTAKGESDGHQLKYLALGTVLPELLLYHLAKDTEMKARIRKTYIDIYREKVAAAERFDKNCTKPWLHFYRIGPKFDYENFGFGSDSAHAISLNWDAKYKNIDDYFAQWIALKKDDKKATVWVPTAINKPGYFGGLTRTLGLEDSFRQKS